MTYDELIAHYSSESDAAAAIGVPRQTVHRWKSIPRIPTDQQIAFEVATNGELKADIPDQVRAA